MLYDTVAKGNNGLGQAIAYFTSIGWLVSIPLTDTQPYDLVVDDGQKLLKVQVKFTSNDKMYLNIRRYGRVVPKKDFDNTQSDLVFILHGDGRKWLIPSNRITTRTTLSVKLKEEFLL